MDLTRLLGADPVLDAEEEAFVIFAQDIPSRSLGFVDSQAQTLEVSIGGCDVVIEQSRGLLTSDRKEGTTGAVLWSITPLLSTWLAHPSNPLFSTSLLDSTSTALELGAGISGLLALALAPRIAHYTVSDQDYVLKLLRRNLEGNAAAVFGRAGAGAVKSKGKGGKKMKGGGAKGKDGKEVAAWEDRISILNLDWETTDTSTLNPVDLVIAADCIYNEALIDPLVSTCASICALRSTVTSSSRIDVSGYNPNESQKPTLCLIAQQLRSPDVFEAWLKAFMARFAVWRVPDAWIGSEMGEGSGFVVYVGVLRS